MSKPKAKAAGHEDKATDDGDLVSRDETHDSIDSATGQLTPEAIARRAELAQGDDE